MSSAPSARVMRFARGRSSVSSDFETCCERGLEVAVVARQLPFRTRPGWEREAEVQRNELVSMLRRMAFGWLAFMDAA